MPGYVVLPGKAEELVEIVRYADRSDIPLVVRGNGGSVFGFEQAVLPSPGICTEARVRMHPVTDDEEGIQVPFTSLADALFFARDIRATIDEISANRQSKSSCCFFHFISTAYVAGKRRGSCPDFDYRIFSTCMQYAEAANWGTPA